MKFTYLNWQSLNWKYISICKIKNLSLKKKRKRQQIKSQFYLITQPFYHQDKNKVRYMYELKDLLEAY